MNNTINETKKVTETKTTGRWVIGPGGVKMRYEEWLEWRKSEMN